MDGSADAVLIGRVLADGDQAAYATLVSRHYEAAYRQACRLLDDPVEAQDLVQEAFLKAHLQLHALRDPACYADWLRHITYSTCVDWHRRYRHQLYRSSRTAGDCCPVDDVPDPAAPDPLRLLLRSEQLEHVREATRRLAPRYRQSVLLFYLDQLSCEQVAAQLGVPPSTARSLLRRARNRLRRALEEHVDQTPAWIDVGMDCSRLPSRQGWKYEARYEFLPGAPAERRVCRTVDGVLSLDDADLFPDVAAVYSLYGVVDPYRPFVLRMQARKERETARYPEYQVPLHPPRGRNRSFALLASTGTEVFRLEIGARELYLNDGLLTTTVDARRLHEYRLEVTPGMGCRLLVDDVDVGGALPQPTRLANQVAFGDLSPATGNFRAQIHRLRYTQMSPGARPPEGSDGEAADELLAVRPFAGLGTRQVTASQPAPYRAESARRLREVVVRCSRRWKLGPTDPIVPVDFA